MEVHQGTKWTDDAIEQGLLTAVSEMGLERMPSKQEVDQFYGNSCLTNAVSKKVGWYKLAQRLGLPVKESETYFGKKQEQFVQEELISMGFEVRRMPQNFPYDLLVEDSVKIDVKSSRLYKGSGGSFYSFNLEKPFCTCDIYVMRLLDDANTLKDTLIIPSKDIPTNTRVSVGASTSKYYRYRGRWDYIEEYCSFFHSVN